MIRKNKDLAKQNQIILAGINEGENLTGSFEPEKITNFFLEQRPLPNNVIIKICADMLS